MIKELLFSTLLSTSIAIVGVSSNEVHDKADPDYYQETTTNRSFNNLVSHDIEDYRYVPNGMGNITTKDYDDNNLVVSYKYSYNPGSGQSNVVYDGRLSTFQFVLPMIKDQQQFIEQYDDVFITNPLPNTYINGDITFYMGYCCQLDFSNVLGTDSLGFWVACGDDNGTPYYGYYLSRSVNLKTPIIRFSNYKIIVDVNFVSLYYDQFQYPVYSNVSSTSFNINLQDSIFVYDMIDESIYDLAIITFRLVNTDIYTVVSTDSYDDGYDDGYAVGKQDGYTLGQNEGNTIGNLFLTLADIPIMMIQRMFDFELFGLSVYNAIFGIITLLAAIGVAVFIFTFVIRKVL